MVRQKEQEDYQAEKKASEELGHRKGEPNDSPEIPDRK